MPHTKIDWSVFKDGEEDICSCRCGAEYMSHAKAAQVSGHWVSVTKMACPKCGSHTNCRKVSSGWYKETIG